MGQQPRERANTHGPEDGEIEAHSESERQGGTEVMGREQVTRPDGHTPETCPMFPGGKAEVGKTN